MSMTDDFRWSSRVMISMSYFLVEKLSCSVVIMSAHPWGNHTLYDGKTSGTQYDRLGKNFIYATPACESDGTYDAFLNPLN